MKRFILSVFSLLFLVQFTWAQCTISVTPSSPQICFGSCVSLHASGADTYQWMPGGLTDSVVSLCPTTTTTYTVTGTDALSNTCSATVTVTVNPNPVITATATPAFICAGDPSSLSATSTVVGTTYIWSPGGLTGIPVTVTPLTTTTYTVTGTAGGCSGSANVTVTVGPNLVIHPTATHAAICAGDPSSLSATSSIVGTTYTWNPGGLVGSPVTVNPISTTTYTVTGTAGGCSGTATITVTVNPNLGITATATPAVICVGGFSSLSATSTVVGTTYTWNPGALTGVPVTVNPLTTTTYTVTGTAGGCTGSFTVTVTVNPVQAITATATPSHICLGDTSTLTASNTTTYNWMPGNLSGATVDVTPTTTTIYTVTETSSGYNCSNTIAVYLDNSTVSVPADITACINSLIPQTNFTSNPPGSTFSWTNSNTDIGLAAGGTGNVPAFTAANPTSSPITATITVTPSSTVCSGIPSSYTITVNPVQNVTATASSNPICAGQIVSLTASNASTYLWNPGGLAGSPIIVSPYVTTTYTVTGTTTGYHCSATVTVTVNPNITPIFNPMGPYCAGSAIPPLPTISTNGITGTWAPVLNNTATTTYWFTPTAGQCATTNSRTITITQNITPTFSPVTAICSGNPLAALPMSSTNGITGTWAPALNNTTTTTYTFTPSVGQCAGSTTMTITVNQNFVLTATASPDSIFSGGFSSLTANSSVSGTTYYWMPGLLTGNPIIVQPATTTTYTVTGSAGGCIGSAAVTVEVYDKYIHDVAESSPCHMPYLAVLNIYDNFVSTTDTIDYYLDFGDGTDTLFSITYYNIPAPMVWITHIYNTIGTYSPSAILQHTNGLADTIYAPNLIIAADSCGDISGRVFFDQNMNCMADSGEFMMSNKLIKLFDQSHTLIQIQFTDAQGFYSFNVPNGNYTVEIDSSVFANYTLFCPSGSSYSITGIPAINRNFGLQYVPGFDLYGYLSGGGFRPNFYSNLSLNIGNYNNILTNAYVQLILDPLTTYNFSTLTPASFNGDTITWVINNLSFPVFGHQYIYVNVHTSNLAVVNDSLSFSLTVSPIPGDLNPLNNMVQKKFRITNSYDPNEKEVSPAGDISATTEITYTIHFQNTGTAEAYNIYILDTLDDNLDLNTLELLGSSHTYNAEILQANQKNILKFLFPDIMLPDSGSNQMLSNGYVSYRISPLANSPEGTYIYNTADIYFDYNAAIATNTVQNVIPLSTSIDQINEPTSIDHLYPNPADQQATIAFNLPEKGETGIEVFDITGKRCMTLVQKEFEAGRHQLTFTVKDLNPGLYFIRINGNGHLSVLKLVKIGW